MTPADLLRHMLDNLDCWADQLQAAPTDPDPKSSVLHVERNMRQTAFFIRRILGTGPPDPGPNGS